MKPFLLLATRAEDVVAEAEYRAFLRFGALAEDQLVRVRLESAPLAELLATLDLTDYSGVVVGGSPFTWSDPVPQKSLVQQRVERDLALLIENVLKHDVPFLGACYGIGALGLHLGAVVDRRFAEPVSAVEVGLTGEGRADPLLAGLPGSFLAYVGHKEAVSVVPPGAVLLASSAGCPVQMFRIGSHQYATQFHPELDAPGMVERMLVYRDAGHFDPAELDALIAEVRVANVVWPARILANFSARYAQA